ncbi:ribonucleases P/MRP protein subunit POP1 isoform X2 [Mercurialis annua]|uniref:ribonucleases P/MRP protein subunit POP1 isoform X2 n=1 Tax=Mercurialis annua TaxID=3986 RepID=UPI002160C015|nr:ribonucleases P/MRP protein subunit POP1 isoform X2 [Mercurialis annua]
MMLAIVLPSSWRVMRQDALTSVLKMVLEPCPSAQSEEITNATVSGAIYGSAMLHHVGAPISQLIAPVTYMWQPIHLGDEENSGHEYKSGGCNSPQSSESCSHRRLWVWIHASAFSEAYDVLKFACQKQMNESGILINCFSLEGQLAKLEVMGSKAFQLLQKILHPVSCTSNNSGTLKTCAAREADPELKKPSLLQIDENVSPCSILSFNVRDPRALPQKRIADIHLAVPTAVNSVPDFKTGKDVAVSGSLDKVEALGSPSCSKPEGDSNLFNNMNLWDARSRVTLPVEENVLCLEKHHLRMDFICLDDPKSRTLSSSAEVQRSCPIMLLKNNNQMGSFMGWSIIVPLSWVRVFWISLISKGAHAIGLREKQWVTCEVGLPIFPADFPDSNGYWSSMETVNATLDQKAEQQPPAVRLSKVPIPPPWTSVHVSVDKGLFAVQGTSICSVKDMVECNLSLNSRYEISNNTSTSVSNLFNGIIARTSLVLTDFLKEVDACQLLLFPQVPNGKRFAELMMDENRCANIKNESSGITYDRKLCFVRVLLHAYKEGVFEEGAIICAPCPSDVSLLTSRSEEGEAGIQIPESSVRSYFTEQASGRWELQLPESIAARETYRWPIGFVTTGFVRGSKKPVAEALCEAVVLAGLREEQWNATAVKHRKKEIYVLVRNMRSSKYRLGLASIVLEQQEDLEFL